MLDIGFESTRTLLLLALVVYLWRAGTDRFGRAGHGWGLILSGFCLLLFGSALDITDNFPSLNHLVVLGDTPTEAFLEKIVGFLGGFALLAIGLIRWLPTVEHHAEVLAKTRESDERLPSNERNETREALKKAHDELDERVRERTAALTASEERFKQAAKLAKLGHWVRDGLDRKCVYVSEEYARIHGYSVEEMPRDFATLEKELELVHPDDRSGFSASVQGAIRRGERYDFEYRIVRPNGEVRCVHEVGEARADENGRLVRSHGTVQDITEHKHAEQALQQTEERFRGAFEGSLVGMAILATDGSFLQVNRAYCDFLGYAEHELVSQHYQLAMLPEDSEWAQAQLQKLQAGEIEPYQLERRYRHKLGHEIWALASITLLYDDKGHSERFMVQVQDITERRRAGRALTDSESRLKQVVQLAAVGPWIYDDTLHKFTYVSEEFASMFGYSVEAFLAQTDGGGYPLVHPDDRESFKTEVTLAKRTGHYDVEYRAVMPNGSIRYVREVGESTSDLSGRPVRTVGACQDVTRLKQGQVELRIAKEHADAANRAKSDFLSSMSHELRTPLNAVLGFAQLLQTSPNEPLSATQTDYVQQILDGSGHLLRLINQVLDLARIESGKVELSIEEVVPKVVIGECLALTQSLAEKHRVTMLDKSSSRSLMQVRADGMRLKQALLNLIVNAIKYNREGGSVLIDCLERPDSGMLRISVTDTGSGIPEQKRHQVFERFNRLGAESSSVEGSGVGLSISRKLVQLMQGSMDFESVSGEGSTFWIDIPVVASRELDRLHPPAESAAEHPSGAPPTAYHRCTVLYVEDNPANLKLMQAIIEGVTSFSLLSAKNAEKGLEMAERQSPDVIVMDINLPGMNGFEALQALRAHAPTHAIPVIALSANAMPQDVEAGREAGFFDYLTKPIKVDEVVSAIEAAASLT